MIERYAGAAGSQTQRLKNAHPYNLRQALERFERSYLHSILVLADWDIGTAAGMLGIHPRTLSGKMKNYEISPSVAHEDEGEEPAPWQYANY